MSDKVWFGRGIYGSKDVPIRILDRFIVLVLTVIITMIIYFALNGGYLVVFDTYGGSKIDSLKLRHGELVIEPEVPIKPGYEFVYWYQEEEPKVSWDFNKSKVEKELVLYSHWIPASVLVKFNLNSQEKEYSKDTIEPKKVVFNESYGELPIPKREGMVFIGWEYSGAIIESDTIVWMTGEHVLNAIWE